MKEFNWEEFEDEKNNIVVHCKTEEEARDFCKQMHEHGMKWSIGGSYLKYNCFKMYKDNTCYSSIGEFSDVDSYKNLGCTILEWSDYMKKEFTKADLKDGMVVETRTQGKHLILGNVLIRQNGALRIENYDDNLLFTNKTREDGDCFDIIAVYEFSSKGGCPSFHTMLSGYEFLDLIWQRNETKRMTVEEMKAKLEELLGEKIEVEVSRNEMIGVCNQYCGSRNCESCEICEKYGYSDFEDYPDDMLKQCYEKIVKEFSRM